MKQKRFILLILALVPAPGLGCTPSQPVEPPSVGPTRSNLATSLTSPITPSSRGMAEPAAHLTLPPGYEADIITRDLQGPTQMIIGPDGWLWLAQLAGGENDGVLIS